MPEGYIGRKFSTIFIDGALPDALSLINAGKMLARLGIAPGLSENARHFRFAGKARNAGNISVRLPEGILITAGGSPLFSLSSSDIALVISFEKGIAKVVGAKEPSSELPMHSRIYAHFPCCAIIHAHDDLLLSNAARLGIPLAPFAPYGTEELAENACKALKSSDIIALEDHGIVSISGSLGSALSNITEKRSLLD